MVSSKVAVLLGAAVMVNAADDSYRINAGCNNDQLMRWFDRDVGLWKTNDGGHYWWQAANMLTAFSELAIQDADVKRNYGWVWEACFNNAPHNNPNPRKVLAPNGRYTKAYTFPNGEQVARRKMKKRQEVGFVNHFYDDEAWWALGWVAALDNTGTRKYLDEAIGVWYDMHDAWGRHKCGGIPWNKDQNSGPVSIANELYIALGASLSNRVGLDQKNIYLDAAKQGWDWMKRSGVITSGGLIMDGVNADTCRAEGPFYTYNQGVILGGLVEMAKATGDNSYLDEAVKIADAVTKAGSEMQDSEGILADGCEKNKSCDGQGDGVQFKGVFTRNLRKLQAVRPKDQYKNFLTKNAISIWGKDTRVENGGCKNGVIWDGPYVDANASSQSSALDCISAALAVTS